MKKLQITDDLDALLNTLPKEVVAAIRETNDTDNLLEVILDLGRVPTARFVDGEVDLSETDVTREQIDHVVEQLGDIDADNRAGLERTLHRISAIRNRHGRNHRGYYCFGQKHSLAWASGRGENDHAP